MPKRLLLLYDSWKNILIHLEIKKKKQQLMAKSIQLKQGVFTPTQTSPVYIYYQYCFPFDIHYFDSGLTF